MTFGTDALADDLLAIGQVADTALDAAYPGIQVQRHPGVWHVLLPGKGRVIRSGSGPTLREALDMARRA